MGKRVGILTFHASHNYGSMLQAYALQKTVQNLGYTCEIINFRTKRQKEYYLPLYSKGTLLARLKYFIVLLPYVKSLKKKQELFESFIRDYLSVTSKEYKSMDDLKNAKLNYDIYLTGSDQIWNTICFDFDWAYLLPFVNKGKKIAYAPSMGPNPSCQVSQRNIDSIVECLRTFDYVSVREEATANHIARNSEIETPIALDPTFLLTKTEWMELIAPQPIIKGDYILLYTPFFNDRYYSLAKTIAAKYNLKVVVTQFHGIKSRIKYNEYIYHFASGPKEFLNLCKNAKCTVGDSFHLLVFSVIFNIPFVVLEDSNDSRTQNIIRFAQEYVKKNNSTTNSSCISEALNLDVEFFAEMKKESYELLSRMLGDE